MCRVNAKSSELSSFLRTAQLCVKYVQYVHLMLNCEETTAHDEAKNKGLFFFTRLFLLQCVVNCNVVELCYLLFKCCSFFDTFCKLNIKDQNPFIRNVLLIPKLPCIIHKKDTKNWMFLALLSIFKTRKVNWKFKSIRKCWLCLLQIAPMINKIWMVSTEIGYLFISTQLTCSNTHKKQKSIILMTTSENVTWASQ